MDEWLPTPEELSAPLHKATVRKESGWRLCPAHPQLLGEKADPGSLVLLVSAREGGRRGSEGRRKGWGRGWGRPGSRPTVSHQEYAALSNQRGDDNDDHQNEDNDGHTDGNKDFLLWERKRGGGPGCHGNSGVEGGPTRGEGWQGEGRRLTLRAFFWFSRATLTCSCPRST